MAIESFLLFIAVAILPAISPGPAILLALSNSLRHGPRSVIYSALGNTLGLTILGFAVAFGLAAILSVSAAAFMVVKIIGAAYLIYLGVKLWRDGQAVSYVRCRRSAAQPREIVPSGFDRVIDQP